jgi:hypothetical protein
MDVQPVKKIEASIGHVRLNVLAGILRAYRRNAIPAYLPVNPRHAPNAEEYNNTNIYREGKGGMVALHLQGI